VLTARECEVLELISDGKRTREMAFILGISSETVDASCLKIMKKLELHSIAELTKMFCVKICPPVDQSIRKLQESFFEPDPAGPFRVESDAPG